MTASPNRVLTALLLLHATAGFGKDNNASPSLEIQIYDYVGVSTVTVSGALQEATRIFAAAGVSLRWTTCLRTPAEAEHDADCSGERAPNRLAVRLASARMAAALGFSRDAFGRAFLPEDGGFGYLAAVCVDCARRFAARFRHPIGTILGQVIAHELGHLLLGENSHAPTGIMRSEWREGELILIRQRAMFFNSEQALRIRSAARDRVAAYRSQQQRDQATQPL